MTEPDVTLTDYALAAECALFAYLLCWRDRPVSQIRLWFGLLFATLGLASLFGGTVHGFFLDQTRVGYRVLWPATMLAIGAATFGAWLAGAAVLFRQRTSRLVAVAAAAQLAAYCSLVLAGRHDFALAVINYLPASIFLLVVFAVRFAGQRDRRVLAGLVGVASTFIAAAIQQAKIGLHPDYFDHNALYHLIQGLALLLMFWSVPALTATDGTRDRHADATCTPRPRAHRRPLRGARLVHSAPRG